MCKICPKTQLILVFSYYTQQFLNENPEIFKLFDSVCMHTYNERARHNNIKIYNVVFLQEFNALLVVVSN